ncbi:MAG TPA: TRAP transporter small permease subunit [Rubrivivax sp.]|nr:TRAP transporter small permease subunit [Rubrivivax sp.]
MSGSPRATGAATSAKPAGTDSYGSALPLGLHRVFGAMNALGTLWILALMVLMNVDVFGRNLLDMPVRGVTELVSLSIVGIVFLQLADTLRVGRFTRADVLLDRLKRERPAWSDALQALFHLVGFALMVVILLASWEPLVEAVVIREYVGAVGDFQAPVWPVRLVTLVGLTATALCFALLAGLDLRRLLRRRRGDPP